MVQGKCKGFFADTTCLKLKGSFIVLYANAAAVAYTQLFAVAKGCNPQVFFEVP